MHFNCSSPPPLPPPPQKKYSHAMGHSWLAVHSMLGQSTLFATKAALTNKKSTLLFSYLTLFFKGKQFTSCLPDIQVRGIFWANPFESVRGFFDKTCELKLCLQNPSCVLQTRLHSAAKPPSRFMALYCATYAKIHNLAEHGCVWTAKLLLQFYATHKTESEKERTI